MSSPGHKTTSDPPDALSFSLSRPKYTARILAVLLFLQWIAWFSWITPARADGGGPQPTNTTLPGAQIAPTLNPNTTPTSTSAVGAQSAPSVLIGTPEVKSFEILIDSNQNATVQAVTQENQAALSRAEALEAQANTSTQPEEFTSPLWVFGFITLVIIILIMNSIARGFRNRA